jgi:hypothetical protein
MSTHDMNGRLVTPLPLADTQSFRKITLTEPGEFTPALTMCWA